MFQRGEGGPDPLSPLWIRPFATITFYRSFSGGGIVPECQTAWVRTVCKDHQLMTKFTASRQRVNLCVYIHTSTVKGVLYKMKCRMMRHFILVFIVCKRRQLVELPTILLFSSGLYMYLSGILKPRHIHGTSGHIVGQIPVLKPRYVPGIPGPKEAGHTNDWCIKMEFTARVSECLSIRTSTSVCFVSSTPLTVYSIFILKKNTLHMFRL